MMAGQSTGWLETRPFPMTDPSRVLVDANLTGVFVDGGHGKPYILAYISGSVMGLSFGINGILFSRPDHGFFMFWLSQIGHGQ